MHPPAAQPRARFVKRIFLHNPPVIVIRADAYPDGLPKLPAELQARVKAANHLYDIAQKLCRECHHHGVLFSIGNLARRFMWDTQAMKPLLADLPHFQVPSRQKFTLPVHNVPTVECRCDATRALGANIGRIGNFFGNRLEYPIEWCILVSVHLCGNCGVHIFVFVGQDAYGSLVTFLHVVTCGVLSTTCWETHTNMNMST